MRLFTLLFILLVATGSLQAQSQFGVQAGLTYNQMYLRITGLEQNYVQGRQAGIHWQTFSNKYAGFRLGLVWEEKGYELFSDIPELTYRVREYHVSLPVQSAVVVGKGRLKLGASGGVYVSRILGREVELGSANTIAEADLGIDFSTQERLDWQYGLQGGLGPIIQLGGSMLQLEGKFAMNLSNRYQSDLSASGALNTSQQQTISVGVIWWWGRLQQ